MSRRTKLLRKENNEAEEMLLDEYDKSVLTDIVVYIRMSGISPYDQERVRLDVREMIAEGERRGKTAREIIGEDYRQFCDDVIAEIPRLSGVAYFLSLLRDVLLAAGVLLVIWAVFQFIEQGAVGKISPYLTVTAGNVAGGVICIAGAFLLLHTICRNTFGIGRGAGPDKKALIKIFVLIFVLLMACMCANVFIVYELFRIHVLAAAGGVVALYVLYRILDAKLD